MEYIKICIICNNEFKTAQNKQLTCSQECRTIYRRQINRRYIAEKRLNDPDWYKHRVMLSLEKQKQYVKEGKYKKKSWKIYVLKCKITGELFVSRRKDTKYSNNGRRELRRRESLIRDVNKSISNGKVKRVCKECNKEFTVSKGHYTYCSDECKRLTKRKLNRLTPAHIRRKILNKRNVHKVDPLKVFERDRWTCKICGCRTPNHLRGTYKDNAPEIDHIIPISKGGIHTYTNVQTLCRLCNSKKSNNLCGQLILCI